MVNKRASAYVPRYAGRVPDLPEPGKFQNNRKIQARQSTPYHVQHSGVHQIDWNGNTEELNLKLLVLAKGLGMSESEAMAACQRIQRANCNAMEVREKRASTNYKRHTIALESEEEWNARRQQQQIARKSRCAPQSTANRTSCKGYSQLSAGVDYPHVLPHRSQHIDNADHRRLSRPAFKSRDRHDWAQASQNGDSARSSLHLSSSRREDMRDKEIQTKAKDRARKAQSMYIPSNREGDDVVANEEKKRHRRSSVFGWLKLH